MRVVADLRSDPRDGWAEVMLDATREVLAEQGILPANDPIEEADVLSQLTADMSERDLHLFKSTVQHIARDFTGTIASVSVLSHGYIRIRLRDPDFDRLVPVGHRLVSTIMERHGPETQSNWTLNRCEVRERGGGQGFLYAAWVGGIRNFSRFLFLQRRAGFIVGLFVIGLSLEIALSFADQTSQSVQLGLRLGAPMLVSSLVLILERYAQWRDQKAPYLRWMPVEPTMLNDPLRNSFAVESE